MSTTEQGDAPRVKFERPLEIRVMTIDGTWCGEGSLIDVSDNDAEIVVTSHAAELDEFFLLLTTFGDPVFRRCKRKWVHGANMRVRFIKTEIGIKSLEKEVGREEKLVA